MGECILSILLRNPVVSRHKKRLGERAHDLPDDVIGALAAAAPDQTLTELSRAVSEARAELGVTDDPVVSRCDLVRRPDRVEVSATVDLVDGEVLEVALDGYAATAGASKELPYAERRAQALVGLARHWLDHAESPATTRVGRPHVIVVVDLEVLEACSGRVARLGSGAVVSGDDARRLAEDAGINRVITRGRSQTLDVGRSTRTVPPHLAKAVIARDEDCRYSGCTAPPWACEIHHLIPWARHGPTAIENLGLLCWHHHKLVHRLGAERFARRSGRHLAP